jgi:hypothetical protein
MKIAELRNQPFLLLMLKDGESEGLFSAKLMQSFQQQLTDMSLRIASDHLSIIYADQIKKGCEIVLGITNLGLISLCDNNIYKAKEIIKIQGVVYCFRAGWAEYHKLNKVSPAFFDSVAITRYALGMHDISDVFTLHNNFMKEGYKSAKLVDVYKNIAASYSATSVFVDHDEDVLLYELQRFLNTALALQLIDSEKNVFSNTSYQIFNTLLSNTVVEDLFDKIDVAIERFSQQLSIPTKSYLQETGLLAFSEFKSIIKQQVDVEIHLQEILELPITLVNELHGDFEGGYDFHADDEDDIAYLTPDEY